MCVRVAAGVCGCVLSMAKRVTLICTAKQISASQTRKMSFVFRDASTAEQQKRNWKTAERKVERESSSRKCYEYAITHSQREAMRTEQPSASAGDKHPPIHTHPHPLRHPQQHRERTMQVASGYEKLFYGCFYSRIHLSLAPIFLCVCVSQCVRLKRFLYLAPPPA